VLGRVTICRSQCHVDYGMSGGSRGGCRIRADPIDWKESPEFAPVAQLDRASGYEPEGRVFESPRAHHLTHITSYSCGRDPHIRQIWPFAGTRWPEKNHTAGLVNEPQPAQLANLPFVDQRLKAEVELIEDLHKRRVRPGHLRNWLKILLGITRRLSRGQWGTAGTAKYGSHGGNKSVTYTSY
jgi:hypothetical protein